MKTKVEAPVFWRQKETNWMQTKKLKQVHVATWKKKKRIYWNSKKRRRKMSYLKAGVFSCCQYFLAFFCFPFTCVQQATVAVVTSLNVIAILVNVWCCMLMISCCCNSFTMSMSSNVVYFTLAAAYNGNTGNWTRKNMADVAGIMCVCVSL